VERLPDEADWFAVRQVARRVVQGPVPFAATTPSVSLHSTPLPQRPLPQRIHTAAAPGLIEPGASSTMHQHGLHSAPAVPAAAPTSEETPDSTSAKYAKLCPYYSTQERHELQLALSAAVGPALCVPDLAGRLAFVGRMLRSRLRDDSPSPAAYSAPPKVSSVHLERVAEMRRAFQAALIEVGRRRQQAQLTPPKLNGPEAALGRQQERQQTSGGAGGELRLHVADRGSGSSSGCSDGGSGGGSGGSSGSRYQSNGGVNPHLPLLDEVAKSIFKQAAPPPRIPSSIAVAVTAKAMDVAQDRAVSRRLKMRFELATAATAAALAFAAAAHATSDSAKTSSQPSSASTSQPGSRPPSQNSSFSGSSTKPSHLVTESFRYHGGNAASDSFRQSISVLGALSNAPPPILSCASSERTGTPRSSTVSTPTSSARLEG
jgi:hypothetical protein